MGFGGYPITKSIGFSRNELLRHDLSISRTRKCGWRTNPSGAEVKATARHNSQAKNNGMAAREIASIYMRQSKN
jgi:hypothetical protein